MPENERDEGGGKRIASKAERSPEDTPKRAAIKADSFSAGLALIASLPLTDAEKADAVRRLMAERILEKCSEKSATASDPENDRSDE